MIEDDEDEDDDEETNNETLCNQRHAKAIPVNPCGPHGWCAPPEPFNYIVKGDQNVIILDPHNASFRVNVTSHVSQTLDRGIETTSVHIGGAILSSLVPGQGDAHASAPKYPSKGHKVPWPRV